MKKRVLKLCSLGLAASLVLSSIIVGNVGAAANEVVLNELQVFKGRTQSSISQKYKTVYKEKFYKGKTGIYDEEPSLTSPHKAGRLKTEVINSMTDMTNFYRELIGVNTIGYGVNEEAMQAGSVLLQLYANDTQNLTHNLEEDWERPTNVSEEFWNKGKADGNHILALGSNPQQSIESWFREGWMNGNFGTIGHRHILLSRVNAAPINFAYAGSIAEGKMQNQNVVNNTTLPVVVYPAPGPMPKQGLGKLAEGLNLEAAWSFETGTYKVADENNLKVTVTKLSDNTSYECTKANGKLSEFTSFNFIKTYIPTYREYIYKQPDVAEGKYKIKIEGLVDESGADKVVSYTTDIYDVHNPSATEPESTPEEPVPTEPESTPEEPAPTKPDTTTPDATKPDTTKPDTTTPDTTKPDTTTPDTTKPDTTKPDTTKPDTTKPDTTKPDTTKPESSEEQPAPEVDDNEDDYFGVQTTENSEITINDKDNAFPKGTKLTVEPVSEKEIKDTLKKLVSKNSIVVAYDISVIGKDGKKVQPKEGFYVELKIKVPNNIDVDSIKAYYISDDGKVEDVKGSLSKDGKTYIIKATHFSKYVLVGEKSEKVNENIDNTGVKDNKSLPKTAVGSYMILLLALMSLSAISINRLRKNK